MREPLYLIWNTRVRHMNPFTSFEHTLGTTFMTDRITSAGVGMLVVPNTSVEYVAIIATHWHLFPLLTTRCICQGSLVLNGGNSEGFSASCVSTMVRGIERYFQGWGTCRSFVAFLCQPFHNLGDWSHSLRRMM